MKNTRAWYYVANDARVGPLDHEKLLALVANSQLKPETLVWAEGMENWETAKNHFAFPTAPPEVPSEPFNAGSTEPIPPAPYIPWSAQIGIGRLSINLRCE